ncbi:ADP-ribose glycohydrolase OARD1 isoform X4 [Gopherus evgoodei]|uniref:ADP-ribose glycohydrolase OARD1 isoform X4 n=1 Tax=Gopherus evgoodei TaxID=1825980 RepID=UPI0011D01A30|nr:ADP-ribose glycohydrolase OARD1 isoform X4 [Gopherus evgoodei]
MRTDFCGGVLPSEIPACSCLVAHPLGEVCFLQSSRRNPGNSLTLPWPAPPPGIRQTESEKKSGEVAVLKRDDRYIYYLITKKKVSHKPTYENMQKSLEAMKTHCLNNGVTDISMPRIGCGLDRLEWDKVSALLEEVFEDTDIKITVYAL